MRIICEREDEIDKFFPEEYWEIAIELAKEGAKVTALVRSMPDTWMDVDEDREQGPDEKGQVWDLAVASTGGPEAKPWRARRRAYRSSSSAAVSRTWRAALRWPSRSGPWPARGTRSPRERWDWAWRGSLLALGKARLMRRTPSMVSRALRRSSSMPVLIGSTSGSNSRSSAASPPTVVARSNARRAMATFRCAVRAIDASLSSSIEPMPVSLRSVLS